MTGKNHYLWPILYGVVLAGFTLYLALDTFVISRVYAVVQPSVSSASGETTQNVSTGNVISSADSELVTVDESAPAASSASAAQSETGAQISAPFTGSVVVTDTTYSDENIAITIMEYREYDTTIYVADVTMKSAEYLQTAFAQNAYGRNITATTSETASASNAILAINGDNYGSRQKGTVIRNGQIYRESASGSQEDLAILADGSFEIVTENNVTAAQLLSDGAQNVFSFGPALVVDGKIAVTEDEEVGKAKASNPRTTIAIVDDLHYLLVVSDGRTNASEGLSLYQLAEFLQELGVESAYNLDGGGSSTMVFNGQVINNPTTDGRSIHERKVTDIIYIGY